VVVKPDVSCIANASGGGDGTAYQWLGDEPIELVTVPSPTLIEGADMAQGIVLEYNGCPKWRVVREGDETFLHCPTTQTRIPISIGALPPGAEFVIGDTDLPTGTEIADVTV
jgi:hypothetical protein